MEPNKLIEEKPIEIKLKEDGSITKTIFKQGIGEPPRKFQEV